METRSRARGRIEEGFMVCGNITDERVWRGRDGSTCSVYGNG